MHWSSSLILGSLEVNRAQALTALACADQEAEEGRAAAAEVQGDHCHQPGPPGGGRGPCVEAGPLRGMRFLLLCSILD